jgi:hypothetical protein
LIARSELGKDNPMNGNLIATSAGLWAGIAWDRVFGWYLGLNTTKASKKFGED